MVYFIIEEVFIDGISFESSLVILHFKLKFIIFSLKTLVLMNKFHNLLLFIIDDLLDLLSFDVSMMMFLHVCFEIGKHIG